LQGKSHSSFYKFYVKFLARLHAGQGKTVKQKHPHISAPRQKFKNLVGYFLNIKLKNLDAKF